MGWRHPRESEIDHELIWLLVSCVSFAGVVFWLKLGLPWPGCPFHEITHRPCLTCGATRCLLAFSTGHFGAAFLWNPLAFFAMLAVLLFDLYAAVVLAFGLPRLRLDEVPSGIARNMRMAVVLAVGANWAYLIWARV